LLRITDVVLVDYSSLIGEAWLMDNRVILLNYPESRYYFDDESLAQVKDLTWNISRPDEIPEIVRRALSDRAKGPSRPAEAELKAFEDLFGKPDGMAAVRIARLALGLTQK
jgi:CDP-glycerol glycerophosphotransferase (TagB/SpsB family)